MSNNLTTVNNESERMWKEEAVARFKVLSWYLLGRIEETMEPSVRIVGILAKILIGHLNISWKCYCLSQLAQSVYVLKMELILLDISEL
jgi:hypothetical protein